jgi:hypothetical protein
MVFLYFVQTLMDNDKLVMIPILHFKTRKRCNFFFFYENILGKLLGFDCMHKDKTYFLYFWKKKINLIFLKLLNFQKTIKEKVSKKTRYF